MPYRPGTVTRVVSIVTLHHPTHDNCMRLKLHLAYHVAC